MMTAMQRTTQRLQRLALVFFLVTPWVSHAQSDPPQALPLLSDLRVTSCVVVGNDYGLFYGLTPEPSGFALAEVRGEGLDCGTADTLTAQVRRYDSQGDLLETISLPFSSPRTLTIRGGDGGFYLVNQPEGEVTVSWVTTGGKAVWNVSIPALNSYREVWPLRGAGEIPGTEGILIGSGFPFDSHLVRIGAEGTLDWSADLSGLGYFPSSVWGSAVGTPDGGAMLVVDYGGSNGLGLNAVRIDPEGGVAWTGSYDPPAPWGNPALAPTFARALPDGRFLVLGTERGSSAPGWSNLFALVLKPDGTEAWWSHTGPREAGERHHRVHSAELTSDGQARILAEFSPPQYGRSMEEVLLDLQTQGFQRAPAPTSPLLPVYRGYQYEYPTPYVRTAEGPWASTQANGGGLCHPVHGCGGDRDLHLVIVGDVGVINVEAPPPVPAVQLTAYPNPVWNRATVGGAGERVEVFDVLGRRVFSTPSVPVGVVQIDLSDLTPGTYVIRRGEGATAVTVR